MESKDVDTLAGDGFVLRPIVESDAALLVAASRTDIPQWTFLPPDLSEEFAATRIRRGAEARQQGHAVRFVIDIDGRSAGTVGAHHPHERDRGVAETFYFVLPSYRRRGLASKALRLVDDWLCATTPELRRLQRYVIVGNEGSGCVAELAGYRREGIARRQIPAVNEYGVRDAIQYGLAVHSRNEPDHADNTPQA